MDHSVGFLKVVDEARPKVREVTVAEALARLGTDSGSILVDVREDSEWEAGKASGAIHIGKGVLERDLERLVPDPNTELFLYCGGGFRSVLAAESAQRMGYKRVFSVSGGFKKMVEAGWRIGR